MAVKPPGIPPVSTPVSTPTTPTNQPAKTGAPVATPAPQQINPEAVAKALKDYRKLWDKLKKPFLSGAAGLFTDNIVFPEELLDVNNPANDVKYLHLLCAVFGLKEMERYFSTVEQREEEESEEEESKSPSEKNPSSKSNKSSKPKKK